jgi:poly(3-hydroxybutyrate) depolymerase
MAQLPPDRRLPRREVLVPLLVGVGILVVVAAVILWLSTLRWLPPHASPIATAILGTVIIGGPIPIVLNTLAVIGVLFLLLRRPTRRRVSIGLLAVSLGTFIALIVFWVSTATNAFGLTLSNVIGAWTVVAFASIALAVVSYPGARWRRRVGNSVVIVIVVLAAIVGINGNFGLDPTIAELAGVSIQPTVVLPPAENAGGKAVPELWSHWTPPVDLPKAGRTAQVKIPGTISGFVARPAGLYLPPAALVKNPPALPLVIMMMGQPGNPDPSFQAQVLDKLAAKNHGLAPIVIVADQIGNPSVDTLCLDTKANGNAQTYITRDVVNWARTHLHVDQDPAHWVIAGYSNGGECAAQLGAKYPSIWENVIDIAGEEYEGWQLRQQVVASVFHDNWSAYSATWPTTLLRTHQYPDSVGIFAVASNDPIFKPQTVAVSNAARAAHWKTTFSLIHNGGHGVGVLLGGLVKGYSVLYPRLGLSAV